MNKHESNLQLHSLYGPGIGNLLADRNREENSSSVEPTVLTMDVRRRRQSAILKDILKQGGYDDLAKMISIHKE